MNAKILSLVGCAVVLGAGCRAADPGGTPFQAMSIRSAPVSASDRDVVSTDADLVPLRDTLRNTVRAGTDLATGDLFFGFEGTTEEENVVTGGHATANRHQSDSVVFGNLNALQTELAGLSAAGGGLSGLLGGGSSGGSGGSTCDSSGSSGGGSSSLDDLIRSGNLQLTPSLTDLHWTATGLQISTAWSGRIFFTDPVATLFDRLDVEIHMTHTITPSVCGDDPHGQLCRTDGRRIFERYRNLLAGGRFPADVTYPQQGLELDVDTQVTSASAGVNMTVGCPFAIAAAVGVLEPALGIALPPGVEVPFPGGLAACLSVKSFIESLVSSQLPCMIGPVGDLAKLLLNPPTFHMSLTDVLTALRDPGGAGPLGDAEAGRLLQSQLGFDAGPALLFQARNVRNLVGVTLDVGADLDGDGAPDPVSAPDGALRDETLAAIAQGIPLEVTGATISYERLRRACHLGFVRSALCDACAPGGLCDGSGLDCSDLCDPATGDLRDSTTRTLDPADAISLPIPASPQIATLLGAAPSFAEAVRDLFANPLPAGAVYDMVTFSGTAAGATTADLHFRIDPDMDGVDSSTDVCPNVFDPDQLDDGDGDAFGQACDACPGIYSTASGQGDEDGDGQPNGCDCDQDGDACPNPGSVLVDGVPQACPPPPPDRTFDQRPAAAGTADWDGDGIPDDCDPDADNDGVPDALDNCPRGDGDATFEPGVDDNPDQTDSGGSSAGDLCDPLCPGYGAPGCNVPPPSDGGGGGPGMGGEPLPGLCPGGNCDIFSLVLCLADGCGDFGPLPFLELAGTDAWRTAVAAQLEAEGAGRIAFADDLDGDGAPEWVVADPHASVCGNQGSCAADAGRVLVLGSAKGEVLEELAFSEPGAELGTALAFAGHTLAVGAPGLGKGTGAVYLFRVAKEGFKLAATFKGKAPGEGFGTDIAPEPFAEGTEPTFLVGAPGADGKAGAGAGRISAVRIGDGVVGVFEGPVDGGRLSQALWADGLVVGLMPNAKGGAGAVGWWTSGGKLVAMVTGKPGDGLGASAAYVGGKAGLLAVGAPGRDAGAGALVWLDAKNAIVGETRLQSDAAFGAFVRVAGDLDGDGDPDLIARALGKQEPEAVPVFVQP